MRVTRIFVIINLAILCSVYPVMGYPLQSDRPDIAVLVEKMKTDERGPFQGIRWFCPDGSVRPANEKCTQAGGFQHALHKDIVQIIAKEHHIYLGQILAGTDFQDFWDGQYQNSRFLQYQVEKYLQRVDDGWIFRRARFYRGAIQAEDEESWGFRFLTQLVTDNRYINEQFFWVRQAGKIIPHRSGDQRLEKIRALSKTISDSLSSFMDLRIKIHGQPESSDLDRVREFHKIYALKLRTGVNQLLTNLENELEAAYQGPFLQTLKKYNQILPAGSPLARQLANLVSSRSNPTGELLDNQMIIQAKSREISDFILNIRQELPSVKGPRIRLGMLELSVELESILFRLMTSWKPQTTGELMDKGYVLARAITGCGFLELWEWRQVEPVFKSIENVDRLSGKEFAAYMDCCRRVVDWGSSLVWTVYSPVVQLFNTFEPLAQGLMDDQIRASLLLPMGEVVNQLMDMGLQSRKTSNRVMNLRNQNRIRGINPGFALGELEVVDGVPDQIPSYSAQKIYVLMRAPSNLKPVAGIATVSEGNLVSHVQLLARNLGIPNSIISEQHLLDLKKFSNQKVFYAVSSQGTVILKLASDMSSDEKALVEEKKRKDEQILIPVDRLDLKNTDLIRLEDLRSIDSGRLCGPKAANLAELKRLFPDKVVNGFIIPFGVFRQHLELSMPGTQTTYRQFLVDTFSPGSQDSQNLQSEQRVLERFSQLREAIKKMELMPGFIEKLEIRFNEVFGLPMGKQPVFIRSDTNMEDLKDFTGAGLNLTVFNVLLRDQILNGIREVWASPYSERSYRWRQKYMKNSEFVFPSILIIPTVDVKKSGVIITGGMLQNNEDGTTVAFCRGAGGAVEGQAAESYFISRDNRIQLLAPCRELIFTSLPETGGTQKSSSFLNQPVLSTEELRQLVEVSGRIQAILPNIPGIQTSGPFDIELGFQGGKIWLFQVRPYVENNRFRSSAYLQSLDSRAVQLKEISLNEKLNVE